ncbi:hypothetical protein V1522DRAFT_416834 [Lipomyces starkeyi]
MAYHASNCPLMAAALAPVLTALAEAWVIELKGGEFDRFLPDGARIIAMNAVSLAFAILANVALLANFAGRVKYSLSHATSSFYIASSEHATSG